MLAGLAQVFTSVCCQSWGRRWFPESKIFTKYNNKKQTLKHELYCGCQIYGPLFSAHNIWLHISLPVSFILIVILICRFFFLFELSQKMRNQYSIPESWALWCFGWEPWNETQSEKSLLDGLFLFVVWCVSLSQSEPPFYHGWAEISLMAQEETFN